VGVSLSNEIGYQRRQYSVDTWTWEIRPIVDQKVGRWYWSLNPTLDRSFHGESVNQGVVFSPNYCVKIPLVYTNVQISNWKSFQKLGINGIYAPGAYFSNVTLDFPVSMGDYRFPSSPEEPCLLHLLRTPCKPGLPCKDQYRAGRYELFSTTSETFERNVRDQLGRILSAGGFDSAHDVQAITVNRWPHGYAYEYNALFEPLGRPASERPCVIGRQPFGRIHIANSDADGHAYTNIAIDQGYRAVSEIAASQKQEAPRSRSQ
jgi:spermidine dehydrogenase